MVLQANSGQQWDYVQLDTVSAPTLWDTRQASGVERHKKVHLSERQVLHLYTTKFLYIYLTWRQVRPPSLMPSPLATLLPILREPSADKNMMLATQTSKSSRSSLRSVSLPWILLYKPEMTGLVSPLRVSSLSQRTTPTVWCTRVPRVCAEKGDLMGSTSPRIGPIPPVVVEMRKEETFLSVRWVDTLTEYRGLCYVWKHHKMREIRGKSCITVT